MMFKTTRKFFKGFVWGVASTIYLVKELKEKKWMPEKSLRVNYTEVDKDNMPTKVHAGDAGLDLYSSERVVIEANGGRASIDVGIKAAIPNGYVGLVMPRSGLAIEHGITCLNSPGVVDSGYRGDWKVILINTDPEKEFVVEKGDRIAQFIIQKVENVDLYLVSGLPGSSRGDKGFGSTGSR